MLQHSFFRFFFFAVVLLLLILAAFSFNNKINFPEAVSKTTIARLKATDSVCYYQCYCAVNGNPPVYINRDSAIKNNLKTGVVTVTEKFSLTKNGEIYRMRHFTSTLNDYPNKKFAYLKLTEKEYWNFKLIKDTVLGEESVIKLAALELKLRPLTEYDFKVENNNYPQIILNGNKISEQRMVEGNYLLQSVLRELK